MKLMKEVRKIDKIDKVFAFYKVIIRWLKVLRFIPWLSIHSLILIRDADFSFDAATIEAEIQRGPVTGNSDNTSRRIAERVERTLINTAITLRSEGRLVGVIKIDDGRSRDGRFYFAKYEWSPKTRAASETIRRQMQ